MSEESKAPTEDPIKPEESTATTGTASTKGEDTATDKPTEHEFRAEVEQKAEDLTRLMNPESSDEETVAPQPDEDGTKLDGTKLDAKLDVKSEGESPKVPFWDFALTHLLVGLGGLEVREEGVVHCGSCQKEFQLDSLKFHLNGDGHKLNTLWNYDRSLAEVTGELRAYPQKFEMEMLKHVSMLNRLEKRYNVPPEVEAVLRELYKEDNTQTLQPDNQAQLPVEPTEPQLTPEELAEIKAEFIASFPNEDDVILIQQALMGDLNGFSSESSAKSALRIAAFLGKMICSYQRMNLEKGYRVNEDSVRDIKEGSGRLLKVIDEIRLTH